MGVGRLDIGIGKGDAQIYQGNVGLQQLQQAMAQRQAQRQADQKALVDQMGKLKPGELRNDADKNLYYKGYDDWRNAAIEAQNERDTRKRMELQGLAQQKYNQLQGLVEASKKRGQLENQVATKLMDNNFSHQFKDDAVKGFLGSRSLAVTDPSLVDPNSLERQVDHTKIDAAFDKTNDHLLKGSSWSNPIQSQGKDKQGNKTGVVVHNERQVDPETLIQTGLHMYDASPDIQKSLEDRYKDIQGATPEETKAARVKQYYIDRGFITQGQNGQLQSGVVEATKPEFKADYRPRVGPTNIYLPGQAQNLTLPYNQGKSNVEMKGYVPLSIPNKNFASTPAYNLTTGERVPALESSDGYSVVGVANAPFIKNGVMTDKNKKLEGSVAQPNFVKDNPNAVEYKPMVHVQKKASNKFEQDQDFLIDYSKLPENVKNSKSVRAALSGFQPAQQQQSAPAKQSVVQKIKQAFTGKTNDGKGKVATMEQINSLAGKKGYEGYSPKELADYYKSLGYTIK